MANNFVIGQGSIVDLAMLPIGSRLEPVDATITSAASPTAKDVTGGASITLTGTLATGVFIPADSFIAFVAPTTGAQVLVQLSANAEAGDSTLDVYEVPEAIAASSVATYPLRLKGRTAANLGRSGNRVSSVDFDSAGFSDGLTTSIEQTIEVPGSWLPLDPGFATAEQAFLKLREVYVWLTLPKISEAYVKGRIYKGAASITALPLEIPADGIITGNISLTFNGEPEFVRDEATP